VKWSERLSDRVPIIIRICIDHILVRCLYGSSVYHIFSYSFGSSLYHCIYGRMFCMLLFNNVNYVFLSLCICNAMFIYSYCYMFRSGYFVSLCCSVYCLCINVYCTTATECQHNCS
jgi:hypothetical protein